jgi:SAM-dependent methyltransferase
LIGAGTLLLEILLTRIFSVTMWYHFAFVAISLALFGIAASGAIVTVAPGFFRRERGLSHMGTASWAMGASIIGSFLIDLQIPFIPFNASGQVVQAYAWFAARFLVLALPFFFSGLVIALAFTHSARQVHRTYFADLTGGAFGCFLVVPVLLVFSGPTAVISAGLLPLLAGVLFFRAAGSRHGVRIGAASAIAVTLIVAVNANTDFIRIKRVKAYDQNRGQYVEGPLEYERWHPVSRVAVHPQSTGYGYVSWFYSLPALKHAGLMVPKLMTVTNDAAARTFLYPKLPLGYLRELFRFDLSDLVYGLTSEPDVLIVGVGGGKDVLSALAFGANRVTGVELNPLMIHVVQDRFAAYTGRPFDDPRVRIRISEGRNYIASKATKYDVIKISVTDTWTAAAMGAYALTENYLYTVEAIREFVEHLKPGGYLSIVRWYPQESLRLAVLVAEALEVDKPRLQMAMARSGKTVNLIVKNGRFTPDEIRSLSIRTRDVGLVWIGGGHQLSGPEPETRVSSAPIDRLHRLAARRSELAEIATAVPFSIVPPTDDRPFFFSPVTIREAAEDKHEVFNSFTFQHGRALKLLWGLLQISLAVATVFVLGPLLLRGRKHLASDLATNVYFLMLGFGYLLVEIPILQRFILFLGHPTYAVTVVLFALLISSGVGSLVAERVPRQMVGAVFPALVVVLVIVAAFLPPLLKMWIGLSIVVRVLVTVLIIAPMGLLLGMPFPIGVRALHRIAPDRVPWAWAVNGAASVGAPVVAMIVAIMSGFATTLYLGTACYVVAGLVLSMVYRRRGRFMVSPR